MNAGRSSIRAFIFDSIPPLIPLPSRNREDHLICRLPMTLTRRYLISCWLLIALAGTSLAKTNPEVVVVPVANMYSGPSDKADVVSQAIYGSNVMLLEARGEWSKIQTSDHYSGWVPSRNLRILLNGDGYATSGPTVQVESLFANLYKEPDVTKHKPALTVPFETRLEIAPEKERWKKPAQRRRAGCISVCQTRVWRGCNQAMWCPIRNCFRSLNQLN